MLSAAIGGPINVLPHQFLRQILNAIPTARIKFTIIASRKQTADMAAAKRSPYSEPSNKSSANYKDNI